MATEEPEASNPKGFKTMRHAMPVEAIAAVIAAGFVPYMREPGRDSWLVYTDKEGKNIGVLAFDYMGGYDITTCHIANRTSGTGFVMEDRLDLRQLTPDVLRRGFVHCPGWHSRDADSVRKWPSFESFQLSNTFNGSYKRVSVTLNGRIEAES